MFNAFIRAHFGTGRGLVRLALSYAEYGAQLAAIREGDPSTIRRLVFVCHGNICRSAYAHALAQKAGLRVASFGLSTSSGKPAHPPLAEMALTRGQDISAHISTAQEDYTPNEGDLLLAMETRHLRVLAKHPRFSDVPRTLLGLYCTPVIPHLHDPYKLDPAYMATCLGRIETAIPALLKRYPGALASIG